MPKFQQSIEQEFKQLVLLVTNVLWLALEWLVLDTSNESTFPVIRLMYFVFMSFIRA